MTDTPEGNEEPDIAALAAALEMLGIKDLPKASFAKLMGRLGHLPVYMPTIKEYEAFFLETFLAQCIEARVVNLKAATDAEKQLFLQLIIDRMGGMVHDLAAICTKAIAQERKAREEANNISKRILSARDEHNDRIAKWRGPSKNPINQKTLKR